MQYTESSLKEKLKEVPRMRFKLTEPKYQEFGNYFKAVEWQEILAVEHDKNQDFQVKLIGISHDGSYRKCLGFETLSQFLVDLNNGIWIQETVNGAI